MDPADSLPARLYLLSFDPGSGRPSARDRVRYLVRAAALTELALRGHLEEGTGAAAGTVVLVGDDRIDDPVLADVLGDVASSARPRSWKHWVRVNANRTLSALRAELESSGTISAEKGRALGIVPRTELRVADVDRVARWRERAVETLTGPLPAGEVDVSDAAVVVLAAHGDLRTVVRRRDERLHRRRIAELTERVGAVGPALAKLLRAIRTAVAAGAASSAGS